MLFLRLLALLLLVSVVCGQSEAPLPAAKPDGPGNTGATGTNVAPGSTPDVTGNKPEQNVETANDKVNPIPGEPTAPPNPLPQPNANTPVPPAPNANPNPNPAPDPNAVLKPDAPGNVGATGTNVSPDAKPDVTGTKPEQNVETATDTVNPIPGESNLQPLPSAPAANGQPNPNPNPETNANTGVQPDPNAAVNPDANNPVPSNPVPPNPVPSNPIPSNPVPSNPIPSNPIPGATPDGSNSNAVPPFFNANPQIGAQEQDPPWLRPAAQAAPPAQDAPKPWETSRPDR